jgi:hypothetical protein
MTVTEVAAVFREYGDVTVVKQASGIYWVDFEEFEHGFDLDKVAAAVKPLSIGTLNKADNATRFTC